MNHPPTPLEDDYPQHHHQHHHRRQRNAISSSSSSNTSKSTTTTKFSSSSTTTMKKHQKKKHGGRRGVVSSSIKALLLLVLLLGIIIYSGLQILYFNHPYPYPPSNNNNNSSLLLQSTKLLSWTLSSSSSTTTTTTTTYKDNKNDTSTTGAIPPPQSSSTSSSSSSSSLSSPRWAYAFLVAGVDPDRPVTYRNYLTHVLVATYTLRQHHSHADVIVLIQLSAKTNHTQLFPTTSDDHDYDYIMFNNNNNNTPMTNNNNNVQNNVPNKDTTTRNQDSNDDNDLGKRRRATAIFQSLMKKLNIQIYYTPRPIRDNFYSAQLAKFEILNLIQYTRVLYLDADVLPLCNMDYLFKATTIPTITMEESNTTTTTTTNSDNDNHVNNSNKQQEEEQQQSQARPLRLKPNVILSWFNEPAHGGFFLLQPSRAYYKAIQAIIERRESQALTLPYPHWDPVVGWGHVITPHDAWHGLPAWSGDDPNYPTPLPHATSTNWTFHGDFADQGLLYYYTKYYLQNVSILFLDHVEQWGSSRPSTTSSSTTATTKRPDTTETMPILEAIHNITTTWDGHKDSPNYYSFGGCLPHNMEYPGHYGSAMHPLLYSHAPHRDFVHFSGSSKPWEQEPPSLPTTTTTTTTVPLTSLKSSTEFWWYQLHQLMVSYNLTDQSLRIDRNQRPNLGRYPTHRSMMGTLQKKLKKQKQQLLQTDDKKPG